MATVSCPGRGAAFFTLLRRAGNPVLCALVETGAPALQRTASQVLRAALRPGHAPNHCNPVSPEVRFLARSISVTAIKISARVFKSGASSIACFSGAP
jgi:hypothetical protein